LTRIIKSGIWRTTKALNIKIRKTNLPILENINTLLELLTVAIKINISGTLILSHFHWCPDTVLFYSFDLCFPEIWLCWCTVPGIILRRWGCPTECKAEEAGCFSIECWSRCWWRWNKWDHVEGAVWEHQECGQNTLSSLQGAISEFEREILQPAGVAESSAVQDWEVTRRSQKDSCKSHESCQSSSAALSAPLLEALAKFDNWKTQALFLAGAPGPYWKQNKRGSFLIEDYETLFPEIYINHWHNDRQHIDWLGQRERSTGWWLGQL